MLQYRTEFYLLLLPLFPNYFITLKGLGLAILNSMILGSYKKVLEANDIADLVKKIHVCPAHHAD